MPSYLVMVAFGISFCCKCCAVSCGCKQRKVGTVMPAAWRCHELQNNLEFHVIHGQVMGKFIMLPYRKKISSISLSSRSLPSARSLV